MKEDKTEPEKQLPPPVQGNMTCLLIALMFPVVLPLGIVVVLGIGAVLVFGVGAALLSMLR